MNDENQNVIENKKDAIKEVAANRLLLDRLTWAVITIVLLAAAVVNHHFQAVSFAIRVSGFIILVCVLALPAFFTTQGRKFWKFALEARMELRKVKWPTRQEAMRITAFVSGIVVLMAVFMWGVDSLLLWLIGFVTG